MVKWLKNGFQENFQDTWARYTVYVRKQCTDANMHEMHDHSYLNFCAIMNDPVE